MDSSLHELEAHLKPVFEAFYQRLLSDPHFAGFFRDDAHVRDLVRRQRENLHEALHEDVEAVKARFVAVGELHHRIFVPYADFAVGIDFLAEQFYRLVTEHDARCRPEAIFRFFGLIKSCTAKGYLRAILVEDRRDLEMFIHSIEESREAASELLQGHLSWMKQVLDALTHEDAALMPSLQRERSDFHRWLLSDSAAEFVPDDEDRTRLYELHERIFTEAANLFYFIENEHYGEVLTLYEKLSKLLLTLNNIVTVLFTKVKMRELIRDPLTGLFDRKLLDDALKQEIRLAAMSRRPLSVIMCDIDDFKQVNDRHGHVVGDCVLEKVAELLRRYIRASDLAYRYGGEELLVVLRDTDRAGAVQLATQVCKAIAAMRFECNDHALSVTLSFGVATFTGRTPVETTDLIAAADEKLYAAKEAGKNRVMS